MIILGCDSLPLRLPYMFCDHFARIFIARDIATYMFYDRFARWFTAICSQSEMRDNPFTLRLLHVYWVIYERWFIAVEIQHMFWNHFAWWFITVEITSYVTFWDDSLPLILLHMFWDNSARRFTAWFAVNKISLDCKGKVKPILAVHFILE